MKTINQKGNDVITFDHAGNLSKVVDYSIEEIAIIKSSVAKGTTNTELAYFLSVCKSANLSPFLKEIWCYKDKKGNLLTFAGRDGFLAHAQKQSSYAGLRSSEVREKDVFKMDIFNNKITHEFGIENRGKIIGAYAVVFRKDGEPTIEWVDFKTYEKVYQNFKSPWETHPASMIKKVAELNALKKAFGLSGVQSEFEFDVNKKGIASPIETEAKPEVVELTEEEKALFSETEITINEFFNEDELYKKFPSIIDAVKNKLPKHLLTELEELFQAKYDKLRKATNENS